LTAGRVVIEGTCLSEMTDDELTIFRRRHIGIIHQFFNLLPTLTAWSRSATAGSSTR